VLLEKLGHAQHVGATLSSCVCVIRVSRYIKDLEAERAIAPKRVCVFVNGGAAGDSC